MGEKRLIKIDTLLWWVSTKIMLQSEQQAIEQIHYQKGRHFWAQNSALVYLYLL